jgi:hypothetical protein
MSTFDAGAIVLFQQLCLVAINVAAWWLWRLMHNSIRWCGDIIDLTRDQNASRSSCRADHSTSSPAAAVSTQPSFHHIRNKVLISNNRLPQFPLTGSQQIIPVPLLIWHSYLLLLPLRQHYLWFKQWVAALLKVSGHLVELTWSTQHQKEHFVNYFLTCYVLPGIDLCPVGWCNIC